MANARNGNTIILDTASELVSSDRNTRVIGIIFTSSAAGDSLVLRESASGANRVIVKNGVANDSKHIRLEESPIIFGAGIYVQTLSSGATATLIVSQSGSAQ